MKRQPIVSSVLALSSILLLASGVYARFISSGYSKSMPIAELRMRGAARDPEAILVLGQKNDVNSIRVFKEIAADPNPTALSLEAIWSAKAALTKMNAQDHLDEFVAQLSTTNLHWKNEVIQYLGYIGDLRAVKQLGPILLSDESPPSDGRHPRAMLSATAAESMGQIIRPPFMHEHPERKHFSRKEWTLWWKENAERASDLAFLSQFKSTSTIAQSAGAHADLPKEWVENGYHFIAAPLDIDVPGVNSTLRLISPNGQALLAVIAGPRIDKQVILPFNQDGTSIFLDGYPNLMAVSVSDCGNRCNYQVTFYAIAPTNASELGTYETYASVGELHDLNHDGFPEIVKLELFYGLWGTNSISPGVPAVFALDKELHKYRHAETRFREVWLAEEKKFEDSHGDDPKRRELSQHFFQAVDALLNHNEPLAHEAYTKAEHLAREVYPDVKLPGIDHSWKEFVADVKPWTQADEKTQ